MNIVVKEVERELVGAQLKPVAVYFNIISENGGDRYSEDTLFNRSNRGYPYKITPTELAFWHSTIPRVKGRVKVEGDSVIDDHAKNLGYDPISLHAEDLHFLQEVVAHWEKIRPHFVQVWSSGQAMAGHISTTYNFPDGTSKVWYTDRFRSDHPESLEKALERVRGKPFDTAFHSDFCLYIEGVPVQQHYTHGRLDYYLGRDFLDIEDEKTIQKITAPQELVDLLTFFSANPKTVLERVLGSSKI